ncbi:MAG TPA: hypothetical protein VEI06_12635 [Gemmatimonadaceae bacterium]|nr:hypothetical protein [Gemmatimonadaceae bacterium]
MSRSTSALVGAIAALLSAPLASGRAQRQTTPPKTSAGASQSKPTIDTTSYAQLKGRYIGPEGNRTSAVAGIAGDPFTYYAGAASGGLWKSTDGGIHWSPLFDGQPVSSIGSVAVAPSDPNIVWVGTGEPWIRSHISIGWGMYKSTDAGQSWTKMGLDNTGRIARIVIDPRDPDRVFVASEGHAYGPQPERGIYRTTDGGKTWQRVLYVNDSTGASDIVMDPNNSRVLYAGTWQIEVHTWGRTSGGAGSGLWVSRDGGDTWTRLTGHGLPTKPFGKVGLGMSRSNSQRVYALVETGDGVPWNGAPTDSGRLFRSDDAGNSWQLVNSDRIVAGRTAYYNRMGVTPDNPEEVYFLNANWTKTLDGGKSLIEPSLSETPGGDHHDIWIDPTNGNRMVVSHDGGVSITNNRGKTWLRVELPIAQIYHVTVDNRVPYYVYGNRQDGPSAMGPSNSKLAGFFGFDPGIPRGQWLTVGGGESGWATPDTVDTNIVWSSASGFGSEGGIVTRYDVRTRISNSVTVWPISSHGSPADSIKYRFVWTFPLTISPHDHNTVYVGSQFVHRTTDGGKSWQVISTDLTRNDKARQRSSGGLTPDNIGVEYAGVVFAIAESPVEKGLIWAGTNDGLVHLTRDGGKSWSNISANIPGLITWGTISNIEASRFDAGTAYLTVDGHQVNNRDPWVYKTSDYGKTWKLITGGLPKTPLSYAHIVKEDPARRGLLYLGEEGGLYVSFDDGANWQSLQAGMPRAPVYGLAIQQHFGDLVVATYGRGFWILDDIASLRALTPEVLAKSAYLFTPRDAYRFRTVEPPFAPFEDPTVGKNPTYGASIDYWLKSAEKDSLTLTILDSAGTVVRTLKGPPAAGTNRAWWDLRFDKTTEAKIRTNPLYAAWLGVGAQGKSAPTLGRDAILAPPGVYSVKLTVAGQDFVQKFRVLKDPSSGGSEAEIRDQTALLRSIHGDLNATIDMINRVEQVRSQLISLKQTFASDSQMADVRGTADSLDQKLRAFEENLMQVRITGRGQDDVRWPSRLSESLFFLGLELGSSDYAPTAQQREAAGLLHGQVKPLQDQLQQLMQLLDPLNDQLRKKKGGGVVISER